jgi:peroxiredoxin
VRADLAPGSIFPDVRLPEHTGRELSLSEIAQGQPLLLLFVRGWWCPKEQIRVRNLVAMQDELQREYGKLAAVTTDSPYVNGAFRAGIGAGFPWLSDEGRRLGEELDHLELSDHKHRPFLPYTFVLDSQRRIEGIWCGFWFWGNPTPEELRQALRAVTRAEQPTYDPQPVWTAGGSAPAAAGIDGRTIWIREDPDGREIQRGVHDGPPLEPGTQLGSGVDGRPWVVERLEHVDGRTVAHLRKPGPPDTDPTVKHHITVPH